MKAQRAYAKLKKMHQASKDEDWTNIGELGEDDWASLGPDLQAQIFCLGPIAQDVDDQSINLLHGLCVRASNTSSPNVKKRVYLVRQV